MIAVSVVAVKLIFSSVEQGIQFEAERGLQVARGLFLGQVQEVAAGASALGADPELLARQRRLGHAARCGRGSGALSAATPGSLFEITDATGRILARCSHGTCDELLTGAGRAGLEPAGRSPVILRALDYERTVSIESAHDWLVVRAALPLTDTALRLLGAVVVTVPIDWTVVDRLKAALGAGREVVVYVGHDPNSSTFMAATGARLVGPTLPHGFQVAGPGTATSVEPLEVDGHEYSVAFGQLQDVNAASVGLLGVAVDREPLASRAGGPSPRWSRARWPRCCWRSSSPTC